MSAETFEALLAPNLRSVRMLVRRELRMSGHAEDVVQQILLRAFASRDQLRALANFRSWLWTIALNEIRAFYRRDRGLVSLDEFPGIDARDPRSSPLTRLERIERRQWLHACIAALPAREQTTIRLLDIDAKSIREAARALDISQSAMKSIHFRARRRLARVLRARARSIRPIRMARAA